MQIRLVYTRTIHDIRYKDMQVEGGVHRCKLRGRNATCFETRWRYRNGDELLQQSYLLARDLPCGWRGDPIGGNAYLVKDRKHRAPNSTGYTVSSTRCGARSTSTVRPISSACRKGTSPPKGWYDLPTPVSGERAVV